MKTGQHPTKHRVKPIKQCSPPRFTSPSPRLSTFSFPIAFERVLCPHQPTRHGQVAVVTGGSRGLGKGIALELAAAGTAERPCRATTGVYFVFCCVMVRHRVLLFSRDKAVFCRLVFVVSMRRFEQKEPGESDDKGSRQGKKSFWSCFYNLLHITCTIRRGPDAP